jgi:hypothetical protein
MLFYVLNSTKQNISLNHRSRFTIDHEFILFFGWEFPRVEAEVHADGGTDKRGEGNRGFSHLFVKVPKTGFTKWLKIDNCPPRGGGGGGAGNWGTSQRRGK